MGNKLYIWSSMKFHKVNSHNCIKVKKNNMNNFQEVPFCPLCHHPPPPKVKYAF